MSHEQWPNPSYICRARPSIMDKFMECMVISCQKTNFKLYMQKVNMLLGISLRVSINGLIFGWLAIYTPLRHGEFGNMYGG